MDIEQATTGNFGEFRRHLVLKMRPADLEMVMRAYDLSKSAHRGQKRDDDTRYFDHLRETALILVNLGVFDADLLISCLLHDAMEDNPSFMSRGAIASIFGSRVADIVVTVTKPKKNDPRFQSDGERHRFYFARLSEASDDVLLVKLADRLHNMRSLHTCVKEKQTRKAQETVDVYLPFCDKLGLKYPKIGKYFKDELTNLVSKFLPKQSEIDEVK
jgi:GTP diphosphokinase / guanosine-3',5'-bis(diphosphate) 3'-diphosphatase